MSDNEFENGEEDFIDDNEFYDEEDFDNEVFDDEDDFQEIEDDWILSNSNELRGSLNGSGQWMSVEPNKVEYVCLTPDMILKRQHEALQQVQGILSHLPLSFARILLQRYKWDAMKMIGLYTDNPEKICKEAGLPPPSEMINLTNCENEYCLICLEEKDLIKMPCGHAFCIQCWREYLAIEVKERKVIIQCCGYSGKEKCAMVVDEFTVLSLLDSEEQKNIFKDALTKSFVEDNPDCKWCPSPGCQNAIMLLERNGESNEAVVCKCGHCFCYRCLQEDHRPCSCAMVAKWKVLHGGEDTSLDEGWVACFSRPCPKCNIPIQKNQGCNHMTCPKCSFHFCWTCMEKFGSGPMGGTDGYSTHKCNGTYMEDSTKRDKVAEIERYQHYSERFDAHMNSAKLEKKLLVVNEEKISAITKCEGFLGNDFSDAMHQILQNRMALKYSYAFGYYRAQYAEYVNKNIFENLQLDLERHTELLSNIASKFVEIALKKNDFAQTSAFVQTRQEMVDQRRIAKKVLDALFDASSHWSLMEMDSKEIINPSFVQSNSNSDHSSTIDITDQNNNINNNNQNNQNNNNNHQTNNGSNNNNNNTVIVPNDNQNFTTSVPQTDANSNNNNNNKKKRSGLLKFFKKT